MPEIQMPKLSDTMTEGTLVTWKKKKGDKVWTGEVLAEIETDKTTMEWESPEDGTLTEIYVQEGGKVNVAIRLPSSVVKARKHPKKRRRKKKRKKKRKSQKPKKKKRRKRSRRRRSNQKKKRRQRKRRRRKRQRPHQRQKRKLNLKSQRRKSIRPRKHG